MFIDYHPQIEKTNFDEMRAHYRDYLRAKNFSDNFINHYLNIFDAARYDEDYESIYELMNSIGVEIVEG